MEDKKIVIPVIILVLFAVGCRILPKRRITSQLPVTPKEQVPSKMMAQPYFEEGMSYYLKGDLDRAISAFAEALKLDPEHPKARKMFEESLKKRTEIKPKEEIISQKQEEKAIESKVEPPLKEEAQLGATSKVSEKKEEIPLEKLSLPEEEKKRVVKKVEAVTPEEMRRFEFAQDLKRRAMYDEAIKELNSLLDEFPKTLLADKVIYLRAETHFAKGEYSMAEKDYMTLIEDYPQSPLKDDALLRIADSYLARAEYDQALVRYLRLTTELKDVLAKTLPQEEKKKKNTLLPQPKATLAAKAQLGVAECYRLKKNYIEALIEYYEVVRSYSDSTSRAQALYYIGHIYDFIVEVRDYRRAVAAYERLIKDHPESPWVSYARERKKHIEKNYL